MNRWNGWGYEHIDYPLKPHMLNFLRDKIGEGQRMTDAKLADLAKRLPPSRLPHHPLITTAPEDRITHSAGQSLPDWITRRSGNFRAVVDGVAYPTMPDEVRSLINYCKATGTRLIPYGGGTSVVGHINPLPGDAPVLSVDMGRMRELVDFDEKSQLATFQAGIAGPDIEAKLRAHGYTLGHYPQSFEFSTLGGWIATRSSGQQSRYYGRIEGLFAGGTVETPSDTLVLPVFPASAAGPDLRELVLGSEGRLGVITEATVRVSRIPEYEAFEGIIFPHLDAGFAAVREIAQANLPLSMIRLSCPVETETNFAYSDNPGLPILEKYLSVRSAGGDERSMLIYGLTGTRGVCRAAKRALIAISRQHGGVWLGRLLGSGWRKNRFRSAYLRNTLWDYGYAVDTLETAIPWSRTLQTLHDIENALHTTIATFDTRAHVFSHLSHVYPTGSSLYTTYIFALGKTPDDTYERWFKLKSAASAAIMANGGTISHQHGVGLDHAPYLANEKGAAGMRVLETLLTAFDADGIMNPGKLIVSGELIGHISDG